MSTPTPDGEALARLLTQVAKGDERAFEELYRRTSARLFGVCLRMLRDRGEAEEALQDAWTSAWRRATSFDAGKASAMTWLSTLARNKAIDRLRQRREQPLDDPAMLDLLVDEEPTPAADAQHSQDYRRLRDCLDQLEPRQRRSVREAFFSGATYNELAVRCQVPLGTMKSWIRRSLLQLRTCLDA
ncbi:MAG: sigma-70 family RNA polymerase sigma factor [Frateuria sp.]|uniref:sigma-70 family RNA polymerase sigma factor n=1 Tax=Frateuria sp. TaxID=2211372 RepID=UPI0018046180|nr:sigma-70 family RNA polymerase sigma factor [Frateuria sp.]NUO71691.1 sigma-70 family RNA polymerase sigma factor [Frateuria sp.]NUR22387.1 sigma-70 family RNA polymerase sigma factor [Frateuria sp.]